MVGRREGGGGWRVAALRAAVAESTAGLLCVLLANWKGSVVCVRVRDGTHGSHLGLEGGRDRGRALAVCEEAGEGIGAAGSSSRRGRSVRHGRRRVEFESSIVDSGKT